MKTITEKEQEYIAAIGYYDRLTVRQLMRLFGYSQGNYTYISNKLRGLSDALGKDRKPVGTGHLTSRDVLLKGKFGGVTRVYSPTTKGYRLLDQEPRRRTKQAGADEEGSTIFHRHFLAVNDLLISAKEWERSDKQVKLTGILTEADIDRDDNFPLQVPLITGGTIGYEPDGWIEGYNKGVFFYLLPEIERQKYSQARWETKLLKMLGFLQVFELPDSVTFPIFTREGEEHRKQLLMWSAEILRRFQREDAAGKFRITEVDPAEYRLFSEPVFYIPGVYKPVGLFVG